MSTNTTSPQTLGVNMRDRRNEIGISLRKLEQRINMRLPEPMWVTDEMLRRIETGKITEDAADPFLVGWIATVLGCRVYDLSPIAADRLEQVTPLVADTVIRWKPQCAGQTVLLDLIAS